MVDSAGGSVKLLDKLGHTKIPGYPMLPMTQLLGVVPVVGIALGACAGLGAVRVGASHLAIMIRGKSQVFAGGPPVVKQALGHRHRQGSARRLRRHAPLQRRRRPGRRHRRRGAAGHAALSVVPAGQRVGAAAARGLRRSGRSLRRMAQPGDPGRQAQDLPAAQDPEGDLRRRLAVRDVARLRRLDHHLPGPAERPRGRRDDQQPDGDGRRADTRRGAEDGALRRPVRHLPPAHRQPGRPAGRDDRPRRRARRHARGRAAGDARHRTVGRAVAGHRAAALRGPGRRAC